MSFKSIIKIGTRGSRLALSQSEWVKTQIAALHPDLRVEVIRIKTKGDRILDSPLSRIGGKGLFVKEIEDALLRRDVDLAVHSIKDVPADLPGGLHLPIFPEREDPRDVFISEAYNSLDELPENATVGTGSLRRSAQLLHIRPDLNVVSIRGNVDSRLRRVESGDLQAIILAAAGIRRLNLSPKMSQILPIDRFLPAVGQGALGLEIRRDDDRVLDLIGFLNHKPTELAVRAERAFLKGLEGGCQVPIAGYGRIEGEEIILNGMVAEMDGRRIIKDELRGKGDRPEELGIRLAERLLLEGAEDILARVYGRGINGIR
jgi:hydroxymethylbilane synthase